jgi:hypothetical protein
MAPEEHIDEVLCEDHQDACLMYVCIYGLFREELEDAIKVIRYNNCITLSQIHYVEKMLIKIFQHFDYSPMSTPYDSKIKLVKNHDDGVSQEKYV